MKAEALQFLIASNASLKRFERKGFENGEAKGKSMDVPLTDIMFSVQKQALDVQRAYTRFIIGNANADELKQALADLRNVAACAFVKLP